VPEIGEGRNDWKLKETVQWGDGKFVLYTNYCHQIDRDKIEGVRSAYGGNDKSVDNFAWNA
jgi:hypothetical protein